MHPVHIVLEAEPIHVWGVKDYTLYYMAVAIATVFLQQERSREQERLIQETLQCITSVLVAVLLYKGSQQSKQHSAEASNDRTEGIIFLYWLLYTFFFYCQYSDPSQFVLSYSFAHSTEHQLSFPLLYVLNTLLEC